MRLHRAAPLMLACAFAVVACGLPSPASPSDRAEPTSSPAASPSVLPTNTRGSVATLPPVVESLPPVVESLAPAPRDCVTSPPPDAMTAKAFGGGFSDGVRFRGRRPAWTLGFETGILQLRPRSADARFPNVKVMWVIGPNEAQPVAVRGEERTSGAPLWFQIYPSNTAPEEASSFTTNLSLDPQTGNRGITDNGSGHWSIWGIGIGALAAGCYRMTVTSGTGSWTADLAIGS